MTDEMSAGSRLKPLVTVVIPTYNRAGTLAEAVESALAQTHQNLEVIVVDDGSTDDTRVVAARFGERIRYVYQTNQERAAARNRGLQLAQGEFIAFLDSDDAWYPHKIEAELAVLLREPSVGFVYSDFELWEGENKSTVRGRGRLRENRVVQDLMIRNPIACSANLMRTGIIRAIRGFNEDPALAGCEDWEAWVRMALVTRFAHLPVMTTKIRRRGHTVPYTKAVERAMARSCEIVEAAGYLPEHAKPYTRRRRGAMAMVNAINYRCSGQKRTSLRWLMRASNYSPYVLLDWWWYYTLLLDLLPGKQGTGNREQKTKIKIKIKIKIKRSLWSRGVCAEKDHKGKINSKIKN